MTLSQCLMIATALFATVASPTDPEDTANLKELSLCDVFKRWKHMSGRVVRVSAEFRLDTEFSGLAATNCPQAISNAGERMPNSIWVRPDEAARHAGARAGRSTVVPAEIIAALHSAGVWRKGVVQITVIGVVRFQADYKLSAGRGPGNGFGPAGLYPAEMVAQKIADVRWRSQR